MLGERVLQVWRWYLQRFRRYRKKTRGGGLEIAPPPVGRGLSEYFPVHINKWQKNMLRLYLSVKQYEVRNDQL